MPVVAGPAPEVPRGTPLPAEWAGGSSADFSIRVAAVTLSDGSSLTLPSPGVTAIVGANNVGKSTVLREIVDFLTQQPLLLDTRRLVKEVVVDKVGTGLDLVAWLDEHASYVVRGAEAGMVRMGNQQVIQLSWVRELWENAQYANRLLNLQPYLVHYSDAMQRLVYAGGAQQRADIAEAPQHPLHYLQDDPGLIAKLSDISTEIFRTPLTLDRLSGQVQLRIGKTGIPAPNVEAVTSAYRAALTQLPPLMEQGDGMRSLLGLLLPIVSATYPIVIVDEPEAFLHPPQALALGRQLGALAREGELQVVLATHDRNVLTGLLQAEVDVSIVRLSRVENTTTAHQLDARSLREFWDDPILRYSNVLDGLFHRLVVLAEADQDCRFLAAGLDAMNEMSQTPIPPTEVLFVPCGGKDGMPKIARALTAIHVDLVAAPDLDILDDEGKLRTLVDTMGAEWSSLAGDYQLATQPFRGRFSTVLASHVRSAIEAILAPLGKAPFTSEVRAEVMASLRVNDSPWKDLKEFGQVAFKGEAAVAADRLLEGLDRIGIVALRSGELENLAPTLGISKGPAWLPAALAAGAHRTEATQQHLHRVLDAGLAGGGGVGMADGESA